MLSTEPEGHISSVRGDLRKEALETLGGNISRLRLSSGMTQAQLADAAEVSRPTISKIERGVEDSRISTLTRIAAALSVEASDLFGRPQV